MSSDDKTSLLSTSASVLTVTINKCICVGCHYQQVPLCWLSLSTSASVLTVIIIKCLCVDCRCQQVPLCWLSQSTSASVLTVTINKCLCVGCHNQQMPLCWLSLSTSAAVLIVTINKCCCVGIQVLGIVCLEWHLLNQLSLARMFFFYHQCLTSITFKPPSPPCSHTFSFFVCFPPPGALLQRLDRDTQKCAFKCSYAVVDGNGVDVYKDPITDPGKKSKKGRLSLEKNGDEFTTVQGGHGDPDKVRHVLRGVNIAGF